MKNSTGQRKFAKSVKRKLLDRDMSVAGLARALQPVRPRTSVSRAIHRGEFPLIRKQIEEALGV
jgi:hypothetical protein